MRQINCITVGFIVIWPQWFLRVETQQNSFAKIMHFITKREKLPTVLYQSKNIRL